MTNPTADAIAALEELAVRLGIAVADDHAATIGPPKARYYVNALRSALLSAQGQAGKPVAWAFGNVSVTFIEPPDKTGWTPLYASALATIKGLET